MLRHFLCFIFPTVFTRCILYAVHKCMFSERCRGESHKYPAWLRETWSLKEMMPSQGTRMQGGKYFQMEVQMKCYGNSKEEGILLPPPTTENSHLSLTRRSKHFFMIRLTHFIVITCFMQCSFSVRPCALSLCSWLYFQDWHSGWHVMCTQPTFVEWMYESSHDNK